MSTTLTTKTTTKAVRKPPYRTVTGELVPQDGIIDIDGPGIDFMEGDDEKGNFPPTPVEQHLKRPPHPGVILADLFLPTTGLTQGQLADRLSMSRRTMSLIINGSRPVTVDVALRLSRAFGTTVQFWLGLQRDCDLWDAAHANAAEYEHIQPLERRAA